MIRAFKTLLNFALLIWAVTRWAFGYIDPNTGGMLFQLLAVLLAFFSALILFFSRQIRIWAARFTRFMRGLFSR